MDYSYGNHIFAKPNMYYPNSHHTNHNMEMSISKKKEPTITIVEALMQVGKPSQPLNYPCHICGIVGHNLTNYPKFGKM
jgi:hypothetical protein